MDDHPLFYDHNDVILRAVVKEGFYFTTENKMERRVPTGHEKLRTESGRGDRLVVMWGWKIIRDSHISDPQ